MEKPAQGAADLAGDGGRGQFPSPFTGMVPCPQATVRLPQYETLPRNMSNFNGWIRGCTLTPTCLDGPSGRRYAVRSQSWTY